jgi:mono/diheme cytochrome c family protein
MTSNSAKDTRAPRKGVAFGLVTISVMLLSSQAIAEPLAVPETKVGHYGYGTPATPKQISGWSIAVLPDGTGLPQGSGTVEHGGDVFSEQCASCHGTFGEGADRYPKLASDSPLTGAQPSKTVGNFWPYATTLFDYINRAMPFPAPHSLPPDDVYAITAYILNLNNIVDPSFVADATSLPKIVMPNRNGFILKDPRPDTNAKDCMKDCRDPAALKIVSTAEGNDLTPKTTGPLDLTMPK